MALSTDAPFDGRNASIVAAATETNVVDVPEDKLFKITRYLITNNNLAATRVRFFDLFTDSDAVAHSSTVSPILLGDYTLQPGETFSDADPGGLAKAQGRVIATATVAGADPADVTAGAWGLFE